MSAVTHHWSLLPWLACMLALGAWHELGLRGLLRRTRRERVARRRRRSLWFYAGLAVLFVAVASPLDYWGYRYFYIHMIQHLMLMFAAPTLIVAGAPWQPLLVALPLRARRRALRALLHERWTAPLRALGRLLVTPLAVVAAFNIAMVGWQLPGPFDFSETHRAVHVWLMNGSMFLVGTLFWLQIIASPPIRTRITLAGQAAALLVTNVIMWLLAMSMSLFAHHSWYSVYSHVPGVGISPFADQLIGAGILWVCGDFWAVPALIVVVRRLIAREEGGVDAAIEHILGGRRSGRLFG
jgi:putative membrane protein